MGFALLCLCLCALLVLAIHPSITPSLPPLSPHTCILLQRSLSLSPFFFLFRALVFTVRVCVVCASFLVSLFHLSCASALLPILLLLPSLPRISPSRALSLPHSLVRCWSVLLQLGRCSAPHLTPFTCVFFVSVGPPPLPCAFFLLCPHPPTDPHVCVRVLVTVLVCVCVRVCGSHHHSTPLFHPRPPSASFFLVFFSFTCP